MTPLLVVSLFFLSFILVIMMATSTLPPVPSNPFSSLSDDDRGLVSGALFTYEAVLKRRVNAEKNAQIREIVERDLARVRVLISNFLEK